MFLEGLRGSRQTSWGSRLHSCTCRCWALAQWYPLGPGAMDLFFSPVITLVLVSRSSQHQPAF